MDDTQQKSQIDEAARKAKEEIDRNAIAARQLFSHLRWAYMQPQFVTNVCDRHIERLSP